jgi:hypothetical protein
MEVAVAKLFCYRKNIIVPNVSWGWGLRHEADLIIVDQNNKATEVEIKISLSDLKADFKKGHTHESNRISRLIYAIPHELLDKSLDIVPKTAGIITVKWNAYRYCAEWYRTVKHDKNKKPLSDRDLVALTRLGCMRIWSLKEHNNR